ncbi:MAG: DNA pilot protein [Microviridae sp.]|nr:MAG: DNA pilot protein [Microviridae sp.]
MGFIETLAEQAGGGIVGAGMGLLLQGNNDRRQIRQQQALTDIQSAAQKDLTDYNANKQLQMWKDTNYKPQMEELRKAGLNPGLVYGMGGAGGQTNNVSQGSVGGGNAPTGGREIQDMMGMGLQMQLIKAQKENIEADTAKKLSEVPVNKTQIPKLEADTRHINAQAYAKEMDNAIEEYMQNVDLSGSHTDDVGGSVSAEKYRMELNKLIKEFSLLDVQESVALATEEDAKQMVGVELALKRSQKLLAESNVQVNEQEIKTQIQRLANEQTDLTRRQKEYVLEKWLREKQVDQKTIDQVIDGVGTIISVFKPGVKINSTKNIIGNKTSNFNH